MVFLTLPTPPGNPPFPNPAPVFFKVTTKWSRYQIHRCCLASAPSILYIRKLGSSIVHTAVAWRVGSRLVVVILACNKYDVVKAVTQNLI